MSSILNDQSQNSLDENMDNVGYTSSETSDSSERSDESSISSDELDPHDDNLDLEGGVLRKYNIITEIGRGGYAIVWLAYNMEKDNFCAIKVQHYNDYKEGLDELKILKKLPSNLPYFNNLIDYFVEKIIKGKTTRRFLCMVFELCTANLDTIIRKGEYKKGLPISLVKKTGKNILRGLDYIHNRLKIFHGDVKPDNLLLTGLNDRDTFIIKEYK